MYLTSQIEIDPSQLTKIKSVPQNSFWHKFANFMTLGVRSKKLEQETFTAISIINEIYTALKRAGLNNIVSLSIDDHIVFEDKLSVDDDLDTAIFEAKRKLDPLQSELFEHIDLTLEHIQNDIKFVIDIHILRKHRVGEYPIKIWISGLFNEYALRENETRIQLLKRLSEAFVNQEVYDIFCKRFEGNFSYFIADFKRSLSLAIPNDAIIEKSKKVILRPKIVPESFSKYNVNNISFANDKGLEIKNQSFYTMFWADLCHKYNIYVNNTIVADELGNYIIDIGNIGFKAGLTKMLKTNTVFEPIQNNDYKYYSDNKFQKELLSLNLVESKIEKNEDKEELVSWLGTPSFYNLA